MMNIKIKQLRELNNFTQEYLAKGLGISAQAYRKLESGETRLTVQHLEKIAATLGMDVTGMFKFDPANPQELQADNDRLELKKYQDMYERLIATKDRQIELLMEFNRHLKQSATELSSSN
jgi:transcriptional regulator with XRE-family HTH domain